MLLGDRTREQPAVNLDVAGVGHLDLDGKGAGGGVGLKHHVPDAALERLVEGVDLGPGPVAASHIGQGSLGHVHGDQHGGQVGQVHHVAARVEPLPDLGEAVDHKT